MFLKNQINMNLLKIDVEKFKKDLPIIEDWISVFCEKIINKPKVDCDISLYFSYGFFVLKNKTNLPNELEMKYEERSKYELSKVKSNIILVIDDFTFVKKMERGFLPENISKFILEILKYKMKFEYKFHQNEEILKSIPELDESIDIKFENFSQGDYIDYELDVDVILDKISQNGIESLTKEEKNFLDDFSRKNTR